MSGIRLSGNNRIVSTSCSLRSTAAKATLSFKALLTYQNRLVCRAPINSKLGFIPRTYKT